MLTMSITRNRNNPEAMMESEEIYVSAVMPCLDEARTIGICIEKALRCFKTLGIAGEVVVADNGSVDNSIEIAESLGARVIRESCKGYGSALIAGIAASKGRIIVIADADDSYDWLAIGGFVHKIEEGFDLVMGNRFLGGIEPGAMPALHRYLGNPVLSGLTRTLYRIPIGDFHCGMRAFTKVAFERMNPRTPGMEFATEMVVAASQSGLRIGEIPTRLYPDKRDRPPHLRSFHDGWRHLRFMLTFAPDYLYLAPGLLMLLLGAAGMVLLSGGPVRIGGFHLGIHVLALASLVALAGANIAIFGLLAKAYHARRYPLPATSSTAVFLRRFTLEAGIVAGLALMAGGMIGDGLIFGEWLQRGGGPMPDTVHAAFIATTVTVIGLTMVFASFLLNMLVDRDGERQVSAATE